MLRDNIFGCSARTLFQAFNCTIWGEQLSKDTDREESAPLQVVFGAANPAAATLKIKALSGTFPPTRELTYRAVRERLSPWEDGPRSQVNRYTAWL